MADGNNPLPAEPFGFLAKFVAKQPAASFLPVAEEILQPFIDREKARKAIHDQEAARSSGVRWSGMEPEPYVERSAESLQAEARDFEARKASHRGRAYAALNEASKLCVKLHAKLEDARSAMDRGDGHAKRFAEEACEIERDLRLRAGDLAQWLTMMGKV